MKFCSVCRLCYDDLMESCAIEDHGVLNFLRKGKCLMVKGYRIDSKIESSLSVEIYQATHLATEKSVLIRFIGKDDGCLKLQKDIKAVAGIDHPNLARVFETGEADGKESFVVLDDFGGQNLGEFLQKISPLLERDAIQITRQIAEGLEALHSAGVVHGAVNPWNIYFKSSDNYNFEVRLQNYDFGGVIQKQVSAGIKRGTAQTDIFRYFSPEHFTGEKIDFRADIYSLAVVFFEMLLGHSPYESLTPRAISDFVFKEATVEELHHDLRALLGYTLRESLQHKKDLRSQTTGKFVRQLRHLELVATPAELALIEESHLPTQKNQIENRSPADLKIDDFESEPQVETVAANGANDNSFDFDLPEIAPVSEKKEQLQTAGSKFEIIKYDKPQTPKAEEEDFDLTDDFRLPVNEGIFEETGHFDQNDESLDKRPATAAFSKSSFGIYGHPYFSTIGKTSFYLAGLIVLVFFSGFVTARIFQSQSVVSPAPDSISVESEDLNDSGQDQENLSMDNLRDAGDGSEKDLRAEPIKKTTENESRKIEKTSIKSSSPKINNSKKRNEYLRKKSAKKWTNPKKNRQTNRGKNKKIESPDKKAETKTRPRFVINEKIVIDPSNLPKGN